MLNQAEIDNLIADTAENEQQANDPVQGDTATRKKGERRIDTYNFLSPARFSKDQLRAIELVHEDLSERLTTSLPTFLRTDVMPRLVHSEQGRFLDFVKEFPPSALSHLISLTPLPGYLVFLMSQNINYLILEQRLGGKIEGRYSERPFTEIDQSLLRGFVGHMLEDVKDAWGKVANLEPLLAETTSNQRWLQMLMGNERVVVLTLETTIQGEKGTMKFFIPFNTLKPIMSVLNPHIWVSGRKEYEEDPLARALTTKLMLKTCVPVKAILGNATVTLKELTELAVGNVIALDQPINEPLVVQVSNKKQFYARVGRSGKKLGIQITSKYNEEDKA